MGGGIAAALSFSGWIWDCVSAWVTVCVSVEVCTCFCDLLLRDCDTTYFRPAILHVSGSIGHGSKTQKEIAT